MLIKINHFFLLKSQYQSLPNWHFDDLSPACRKWRGSHTKKNFDNTFRITLPLSWETDLYFVWITNTKYIVCLSFPEPQSKFNWVSKAYLLLWKSQQGTHTLAQWNMIGHRLFDSEPVGNIFDLHATVFEIPNYRFMRKPPASWGMDVSIEIYNLLLLFSSIISPCSNTVFFCEISKIFKKNVFTENLR